MTTTLFSPMSVEDAVSSVLICAVVLLVLVGNILVVAAVATTRKLRTVTNIFIVNLACADLLLGILVLPFSAVFEILNTWIFGHVWCQVWLAVDVWVCTVSIINLCCISLDRYLAITRPIRYPGLMSSRRAKTLVAGVWLFSFIICCPPLIGWNDMKENENNAAHWIDNSNDTNWTIQVASPSYQGEIRNLTVRCVSQSSSSANMERENASSCFPEPKNNLSHTTCELTNSRGYRIYAALGSFFIPMLVMVFFYLQIYRAAVSTISAYEKGVLRTKYSSGDSANGAKANCVTLRVHRGGGGGGCRSAVNVNTTHAAIHKSRSSDASLVTLADLAPTDLHVQREHLRSPSPMNNETQRKGCFRWINGKKDSRSLNRMKDSHGQVRNKCRPSVKNGGQNICGISMDSDDSLVAEGRPRLKGSETQPPSSQHISNASVPPASTTQQPGEPSEAPLSRSSSASEGRSRRSRFSVQKPANTVKLHMQKFNREKKAAKTLAIIVGAFILCWMPFFTIYLVGAFCENCISPMVFSVAFWLGYCNSAMNPCVYALFSRDFRGAFRKLLTCRTWSRPPHFKPTSTDVPAIQLHCAPQDDARSSSDIEGNHWR